MIQWVGPDIFNVHGINKENLSQVTNSNEIIESPFYDQILLEDIEEKELGYFIRQMPEIMEESEYFHLMLAVEQKKQEAVNNFFKKEKEGTRDVPSCEYESLNKYGFGIIKGKSINYLVQKLIVIVGRGKSPEEKKETIEPQSNCNSKELRQTPKNDPV